MPFAAVRRAVGSRASVATASLIVGAGIGAAGTAAMGGYAAQAASPPPTAMDRIRQRAGVKDGTDPWGQPQGAATRKRMAEIDVHTLSTMQSTSLES